MLYPEEEEKVRIYRAATGVVTLTFPEDLPLDLCTKMRVTIAQIKPPAKIVKTLEDDVTIAGQAAVAQYSQEETIKLRPGDALLQARLLLSTGAVRTTELIPVEVIDSIDLEVMT